MVDIFIGRSKDEIEKYGKEGTIFIGKEYIKMENLISLANNVYLDVNRSHLVFIVGKRGQGKSYTLASITESMVSLPKYISKNLAPIIFDTMGIFWTMKFPNYRDAELLEMWGLKPKPLENVRILVPFGLFDYYKELEIPVDEPFSIDPSELSGFEWTLVFNLNPTSNIAIFIQKVIRNIKKRENKYSLDDIIRYIDITPTHNPSIKEAALNYFESAIDWGLFSEKASPIKDLAKPGYVNILDVSGYTALVGGWSIKNLVIGIISKKIFYTRMLYRKKEELEEIYFGRSSMLESRDFPLVWIIIDEAHECLPKDSVTPASEPLIQIIREGRQPGISLILATQQPGKMHTDVLTQTDILISHRVTAQDDLEALNKIMRNFSSQDIDVYMNRVLPKKKGAALILDDKSEKIYPVQIKPRMTWHGGEDPHAIRKK